MFYKNIFNDEKVNGSVCLGSPDPFIIKSNGYYYLTFTYCKQIKILKSFDLIHFENVNSTGFVSDDELVSHAFAPEIIYHNGYYYLVGSPLGNGHYILKSKSLEGPFERVSDNFQELIDGSFFIDSNEKKYFLRASESGIVIKKFAKEFSEKNDFDLFDDYFYFKNSIIGGWTEGPYLIKRYGVYYLTYTGTHFLSDCYRVDYCSGKELTADGLTFMDTLLLSTDEDFYSLGHSMNFVGPNLDSYYIAYHNRIDDNRFLNISHLLFSKNGQMVVNGLKYENMFERPTFEKFIDKENYLREEEITSEKSTIEFNFIGEDAKMIFSYLNEKNYSTIYLQSNSIIIDQIQNGKIKNILSMNFKNQFDVNVLHTFRIQFNDSYVSLYLDNVEYFYHQKLLINKGKFGFINNKLNNAYLAYSKHSEGSSDISTLKLNNFFVNNTDDDLKTNIYIDKDGEYLFSLKYNVKENSKVYIDNKQVNLKDNMFFINLEKGIHLIKFENVSLNALVKKQYLENKACDLSHYEFIKETKKYGRYLTLNTGLYFENDRNCLLTPFNSFNYSLSSDLKLVGNPQDEDRFIGLVFNVENYAKDNPFEGAYSLQGYIFALNSKYVYIIDANFYYSKVLKKFKLKKIENNLKIEKINRQINFYLNNELVYSINKKDENLIGKCGIYMNHASGIFSNINLKQIERN